MTYTTLYPASKDLLIKLSIMKTIMYRGTVWGLYYRGWAIKSDHEGYIFPIWLNGIQAYNYAKRHWPNYAPRRISPEDFQNSLLPTLQRFNVQPALVHHADKLKIPKYHLAHFFKDASGALTKLSV